MAHVDTELVPGNYQYLSQQVTFMISEVCLEKSPFEDLAIWNPIVEKMKEVLSGTDDTLKTEFSCDSGLDPFRKLKYKESSGLDYQLTNGYEIGVI